MDLIRHLKVLWRFRVVVILAVLFGIGLAVLAAYQVPSMERRGVEVWSVESDTLVTQPGFPEGRVTLPPQVAPVPGEDTAETTKQNLEFADPGRFSSLALLYSVLAQSDQVRARIPTPTAPGQVQARAYDVTGTGSTFLPIIKLTTTAGSPQAAMKLNMEAQQGLKDLIEEQQRDNDIAPNQRVRLSALNEPTQPMMISGPSLTPSILALMLCLLGAVALAHILEALRPRDKAAFEDFDDVDELDDGTYATLRSFDEAVEARNGHPQHAGGAVKDQLVR
jgi:hypothetical protein